MALCLADSLIKMKRLDQIDLKNEFINWFLEGKNNPFASDEERENKCSVGLGGNIQMSLKEFMDNSSIGATQSGDKNTNGCGSIMRLAPIPIFYHNKSFDEAI